MVTNNGNNLRVRECFRNKTIFITGASGFIGKALLEKLLRSCPDLKKIYVLMRPKRNQSSKERLEKLFSSEVNI